MGSHVHYRAWIVSDVTAGFLWLALCKGAILSLNVTEDRLDFTVPRHVTGACCINVSDTRREKLGHVDTLSFIQTCVGADKHCITLPFYTCSSVSINCYSANEFFSLFFQFQITVAYTFTRKIMFAVTCRKHFLILKPIS